MKEKKLTRKQMIAACVDDQIERGIIKADNREMQINKRLKGSFSMSLRECENWYNSVFNN